MTVKHWVDKDGVPCTLIIPDNIKFKAFTRADNDMKIVEVPPVRITGASTNGAGEIIGSLQGEE